MTYSSALRGVFAATSPSRLPWPWPVTWHGCSVMCWFCFTSAHCLRWCCSRWCSSSATCASGAFSPFSSVAIFILLAGGRGRPGGFWLFCPAAGRSAICEEFGKEMPHTPAASSWKGQAFPSRQPDQLSDFADKIQDFAGQSATYLLLSLKNWAEFAVHHRHGPDPDHLLHLEGDMAYRWVLSLCPAAQPRSPRPDAAPRRGPHGQVAASGRAASC